MSRAVDEPGGARCLSYGRLLLGLGHRGRLAATRNGPGDLGADQARRARCKHLAVATAWLGRLKGAPRMKIAVGQAGDLLASAEMEVCHLRVAYGPAAG